MAKDVIFQQLYLRAILSEVVIVLRRKRILESVTVSILIAICHWMMLSEVFDVCREVGIDDILGDELPLTERLEVDLAVGCLGRFLLKIGNDETAEVGIDGRDDALGDLSKRNAGAELEMTTATIGTIAIEGYLISF